ncbi:MAG: undecaprenyl-diphosphate phosphatase [Saccharospirillum sp.]
MEWLQVIVLSIVQGLTEFLPISSSGHLILVPVLTPWPDQGLAFDVALHLGTLSAVVWYFRGDILSMIREWLVSLKTRTLTPDARLGWAIIFGTIPVGLAGLAFQDVVESVFRSPLYIAVGLIVFGLLLAWADWRHKSERSVHSVNWKDVLVIGLAQAVALFPGTSRSGITMTAALFMGLSREAAARFSFLLSIPVIFLACGLETKSLIDSAAPVDWPAMFAGVVLSGISAYLCIHFFLAFINRIGMMPFVIYRLVLGGLLLMVFW